MFIHDLLSYGRVIGGIRDWEGGRGFKGMSQMGENSGDFKQRNLTIIEGYND